MSTLPNNLYTAEKTRELDNITISEFGVSGTVLMERAGAVAYETIKQRWPDAKTLCIVCGTGNNGGDGFVLARLAKEEGITVEVQIVGDENKIKGDALAALQRLAGANVSTSSYLEGKLPIADVIVDALFGTGLSGEVKDSQLAAINAMNQHGAPILALDIPSGLAANTGQILGQIVKANATVAFIGLNQGLLTADGPDCAGEIIFDDLRIVKDVFNKVTPSSQLINSEELITQLAPRKRNGNKGIYGHVLVVGGDIGMSGAARMACEAALRAGAGLVSLATRYAHASIISANRPEIMSYPTEREEEAQYMLNKASVVAIGPGLGQSEWAVMLFGMAVSCDKPLIVDADALNLLAIENIKRDNWILTPHPGEAARMLGKTIEEIQEDRFSSVAELEQRFGGTVVLKGCGSLVYSGDMPKLCHQGNPGMASGGMGDVLTGVIAALVAQGMSLADAAQLGVSIHAQAGDMAVKGAGERGLLASDLMPVIRRLVNSATL